MKEFKGDTAFVTGPPAASVLPLARTFLDRGMNVMTADIEDAALNAATRSLSNRILAASHHTKLSSGT